MLFSERIYKILKEIALVWLPGFGGAYFGLASIWHLPYGEQIVGTITIVDTFLGLILKVSTATYNASDAKYDGTIKLEDTEDGQQLRLLNVDRDAVLSKQSITFKVTSDKPVQPVS